VSVSSIAETTIGTATTTAVSVIDDETAIVSIAASDTTATEGSTALRTFTVTLNRTNDTGADIVITYLLGGSATAADVDPLSGTVTIAPGETSATIAVMPLADTVVEGDERLTLTLTGTSFARATVAGGAAASATMIVIDANESVTAAATAAPVLARSGVEIVMPLGLALLLLALGTAVITRRRQATS
jgi:hypothetical protein